MKYERLNIIFMNKGINMILPEKGLVLLKSQLKIGYLVNAEESLVITADWFLMEEEIY